MLCSGRCRSLQWTAPHTRLPQPQPSGPTNTARVRQLLIRKTHNARVKYFSHNAFLLTHSTHSHNFYKHRVTIPYKWSFEKCMKSMCFSYAFHVLFVKSAFHEKHLCFLWKVHFSWKAPESNKNSWTQHRSLILTWSEGMHVVHMPFRCFSCAFHF